MAAPAAWPLAGKVPAPPAARRYWGAYRRGAPYDRDALGALEAQAGRVPAILMWYQEWTGGPLFDVDSARWLEERGIVPMVSWEPWKPPARFGQLVVDQPAYSLRRIASGALDAFVERYAQAIKEYGGPVMLRPMHEMDGFWYPWSGLANGNRPADYVAAWRHLRAVFERVGATNVTWVWSVNHRSVPATPENSIARYWPGARFVDWIGVSGFNWGDAGVGSTWKGFDAVYRPRYRELTPYRKPIMLTEIGAPEAGGDKGVWIRDAFSAMARYPAIRAIVWYDKRDTPLRDWRIESSPRARASFRRAIAAGGVLSAPAAVRATRPVLFRDAFSRRGAGSWGAEDGLEWASVGTTGLPLSLAVDGGHGVALAGSGVNKGDVLVGPSTADDLEVSATFSENLLSLGGTANHWAVLARASGPRTYYAFQLYPEPRGKALLAIYRASEGRIADLSEAGAPFRVAEGGVYRVRGRIVTEPGGVRLLARAWPASDPEPASWQVATVDRSAARLLGGRVGVRLSFYAGPARMTVDDFEARRA
ncbi:MAG: hypothetical protein HY775_05135 [Acidobacteria bacterium]|nr:hypothetical protein [Acidobacteriota bacterium]